ncbi:hypothetical protein HDV62DRAFT_358284 [Trichoderma sp. SZMC 28011]
MYPVSMLFGHPQANMASILQHTTLFFIFIFLPRTLGTCDYVPSLANRHMRTTVRAQEYRNDREKNGSHLDRCINP